MPRKSQIVIALTLAFLQSVAAWPGDAALAQDAGAAPEGNRDSIPTIAVTVPSERRIARISPGMEAGQLKRPVASLSPNLFSSFHPASYISRSVRNETLSPEPTRTETVHIQASPSAPGACGPSSMSVEDVKALVVDRSDRYEVNPDFALAIAWAESRFDRVRNSPRGARGPMQLMPDTARLLNVVDVCDPVQNIDGGIRHLRALLDEFKNPIIAAAAYNAGVKAIYDNGGVPAYAETVRYVASVINHQFGLDFPRQRQTRRSDPATNVIDATDRNVIGARPPQFIGGVMQF